MLGLAVLCLSVTGLAAETAAYEIHINVGGPEHVMPDGRIFLADGPYSPEQGYGWNLEGDYVNWRAVGGCLDDAIYKHFHSSPGLYRIDVPNGVYAVTLHFSENWGHSANLHRMDWAIEGALVLDDLDVYAQVESDYALDYRFPVSVADGQIVLDDSPLPHTQLGAISVVGHPPDATPPSPPVLTEILNGLGEVILNWEDHEEPDLAGYRVYRRLLPIGPFVLLTDHPHEVNLVSRYIDRAVAQGSQYEYEISAVDIFGNESARTGPFAAQPRGFADAPLPVCSIEIDPDSLWLLNQNVYDDDYYSCTVTLGGTPYAAGLRYRGNIARPMSKKSYKIRLSGALYENRTKLNCNADMCDACGMRSPLSMWLFEHCGVPAPRTWLRALVLNNQYMGYYCDVEQVDRYFLENHDLDGGASIYKCFDRLVALDDSLDYHEHYEKETNEDQPWSDLITFIETLNSVPDEDFYETFINWLDFDAWLRYYAVLNTVDDGDSFSKNYYLCHDLDRDLWSVIPWDKDLSWGTRLPFHPGIYWEHSLIQHSTTYGNILAHRMMAQPVLRNLYASVLYEHVTELAPLDTVFAAIDAAHAEVEPAGEVDVRKWYWEDNERFRGCDAEIRMFAEGRYGHILDHVEDLVVPQRLYINEFMADNDNVIADEAGQYEDWLEIYNPGPDPMNMRDYFLTDDLSEPLEWRFPDTTLAAEAYLLVWADEDPSQGPLHADFKLSRDGELIALHKIEDGVQGDPGPEDIDPVDLIFFGEQPTDIARGRIFDADLRWGYLTTPSPGETNGNDQGIGDFGPGHGGGATAPLRAAPNPFQERVRLRLPDGYTGRQVEIYDVAGRLCRRLETAAPGAAWYWDGYLADGQPAPPGVYWARARVLSVPPVGPRGEETDRVAETPEEDGHFTRAIRLLLLR